MTPTTSRHHAIVLGGSMAGLLAPGIMLRVWQANRRLAQQAGRDPAPSGTAVPQIANEPA